MAWTKDEEAIVEGYEEIGGRKRANDDKGARPAKRAKVEGNEASDCRNLVEKEEGEAAGNRTKEEEELNNKVGRLCGLLEDNPRRLRNKDVEDVIHYLEVDEIMRLAMKSDKAKGNAIEDYGYVEEADFLVPSNGKVLSLLTLMLLSGIEKLKEVDLFILYQNLPKLAFAQLLLSALGSYIIFHKADERVRISKLCYALPWKLFTHVMYHRTSLPQFKRGGKTKEEEEEEEEDEECTSVEKKAAESCEICYGKGMHSGVYGYHCSFWDCVPSGLTVGPSHLVRCRDCCLIIPNAFVKCLCGSRIGQAVPRSVLWKFLKM